MPFAIRTLFSLVRIRTYAVFSLLIFLYFRGNSSSSARDRVAITPEEPIPKILRENQPQPGILDCLPRKNPCNYIGRVYFVVRLLKTGSAQHRAVQPAYMINKMYNIPTSVLECRFWCSKTNFNTLTSEVLSTEGHVYFIHNNRPCDCMTQIKNVVHLFDVMDILHILPTGFHAYILATKTLRDSYREKLDRGGMSHVQTKIVPYHHSNLMNRLKASNSARVSTVGYFGSRPNMNMLESVQGVLDTYHPRIELNLGPVHNVSNRGNMVPGFGLHGMKKADVRELWNHSVKFSDGFALNMSRLDIGIVWDQCSLFVDKCTTESCVKFSLKTCLQNKGDQRFINHIAVGVPTIVYGKYACIHDILKEYSYPLVAHDISSLLSILRALVASPTLRELAQTQGKLLASSRDLCNISEMYVKALCKTRFS